jgi:hypothetical protein
MTSRSHVRPSYLAHSSASHHSILSIIQRHFHFERVHLNFQRASDLSVWTSVAQFAISRRVNSTIQLEGVSTCSAGSCSSTYHRGATPRSYEPGAPTLRKQVSTLLLPRDSLLRDYMAALPRCSLPKIVLRGRRENHLPCPSPSLAQSPPIYIGASVRSAELKNYSS